MRIAHVVTSTNIGGAQIMLQRYLEALGPEARNHEVISLMDDGDIAAPIRATGAQLTTLGLRQGRVTLGGITRLRRRLRERAPDVVHGWMYHGCLAASAALAGRSRARRPGLVWGIHHSLQDLANESRKTQLIIAAMARLSSGVGLITYCSDASRVQHEGVGFDPAPGALIPNAVDTGTFQPDAGARARLTALLGVTDERLLIGNIARNHPMKDHVSMVRAIAFLRADGHDVHGVMIGEGHEGSAAEAEVRALDLGDRISMIPARSDIHALIPGLDMFLLCSAWGEAFPLAVCEAMACELPCVVTDVGDCAALVGEAGRVVPPADPLAQAHALAELIRDGADARRAIGRMARARVSHHYSTERYVALHDAAYRHVAAGQRSGVSERWPASDLLRIHEEK